MNSDSTNPSEFLRMLWSDSLCEKTNRYEYLNRDELVLLILLHRLPRIRNLWSNTWGYKRLKNIYLKFGETCMFNADLSPW